MREFFRENHIDNLNDIEVIEEGDTRFLTSDGEKSFDGVKNINGKTYAYKNDLNNLITLLDKSKTSQGISFFEKMSLSNAVSQWGKSSIYPLNQFDEYLTGKMSDIKKDTARVAVDA